jgi:hypothetical protein
MPNEGESRHDYGDAKENNEPVEGPRRMEKLFHNSPHLRILRDRRKQVRSPQPASARAIAPAKRDMERKDIVFPRPVDED